MRIKRSCLFVLVFLLTPVCRAAAKDKSHVLIFTFGGHPRTVYFYAPPDSGERPIVVLLHGSGRDGTEMLDAWKPLAVAEHFILAAPNALDSSAWDSKVDPPAFLHAVVDQIKAIHAVDSQRIYLFGHSGGAVYALALSLVDSGFYAATAVHAGALPENGERLFRYATRRMPIAIWVGDRDPLFPLARISATKAQFESHAFTVKLKVIEHHGHEYSQVADEVDRQAWKFFTETEQTP